MGADVEKSWIRATGRDNWVPTEKSTICSKHFKDDDFTESSESGYKYLKSDACPSVNIESTLPSPKDSSGSTDVPSDANNNILNNGLTCTFEQLQALKALKQDLFLSVLFVFQLQQALLLPSTAYQARHEELGSLMQIYESNFSTGSKRTKLQSQLFQYSTEKDASRKRKKCLGPTEIWIMHQKRQIAILQGQNLRLRRKIKLIEAVIDEIKKFANKN